MRMLVLPAMLAVLLLLPACDTPDAPPPPVPELRTIDAPAPPPPPTRPADGVRAALPEFRAPTVW